MYEIIVPLLGLLIIIGCISFIIVSINFFNKKWKKLSNLFSFNYIGQKNMVIPNELKKFRYFLNHYSNIRLNLLIQSKNKDFKIYKYTSNSYIYFDRYKFHKKIIISSKLNKNFGYTSIFKKKLLRIISSMFFETIYGKDYLKLLVDDVSNKFQILTYDQNLDNKNKIKNFSFYLENDFPFESIELKDNEIIFIVDFSLFKNYKKIIYRSKEIVSYLNNL